MRTKSIAEFATKSSRQHFDEAYAKSKTIVTIRTDYLAGRLAAQFSRENKYELVDRAAMRAVTAAHLCDRIETKLLAQKKPTAEIKALERVCAEYGGKVIQECFGWHMRLSLKFPGGRHSTRRGDLMPLNWDPTFIEDNKTAA